MLWPVQHQVEGALGSLIVQASSALLEQATDLKAQADEALIAGNNRDAYSRYTQALAALPAGENDLRALMLSNRAAAFTGAKRWQEAVADAQVLILLKPSWHKSFFRAAKAHEGAGQWLTAARHYAQAWQLLEGLDESASSKQRAELEGCMQRVLSRLTRPQLATELLAQLSLTAASPIALHFALSALLPSPGAASSIEAAGGTQAFIKQGATQLALTAGQVNPLDAPQHPHSTPMHPASLPQPSQDPSNAPSVPPSSWGVAAAAQQSSPALCVEVGEAELQEATFQLVKQLVAAGPGRGYPSLVSRLAGWLTAGRPTPSERDILRAALLLRLNHFNAAVASAAQAVSALGSALMAHPTEETLDRLAHACHTLGLAQIHAAGTGRAVSQPGLFHRGLQSLALARELSPGDKVYREVLCTEAVQAMGGRALRRATLAARAVLKRLVQQADGGATKASPPVALLPPNRLPGSNPALPFPGPPPALPPPGNPLALPSSGSPATLSPGDMQCTPRDCLKADSDAPLLLMEPTSSAQPLATTTSSPQHMLLAVITDLCPSPPLAMRQPMGDAGAAGDWQFLLSLSFPQAPHGTLPGGVRLGLVAAVHHALLTGCGGPQAGDSQRGSTAISEGVADTLVAGAEGSHWDVEVSLEGMQVSKVYGNPLLASLYVCMRPRSPWEAKAPWLGAATSKGGPAYELGAAASKGGTGQPTDSVLVWLMPFLEAQLPVSAAACLGLPCRSRSRGWAQLLLSPGGGLEMDVWKDCWADGSQPVAVHSSTSATPCRPPALSSGGCCKAATLVVHEPSALALGSINGTAGPLVVHEPAALALCSSSSGTTGALVHPDRTAGPVSHALPLPATPALATPYAAYRLVNRSGMPVERPTKHPFALSRVFYNPDELPTEEQQVWFEPVDGCCRWRQTASTVHVLVTQEVRHKLSGTVFLAGRLERGVVPSDSTWWIPNGGDEAEQGSGCVLELHKMNLELHARGWRHADSWWPRLLSHHAEVAWDDSIKDYSDLPQHLLESHARQEAQAAAEAGQE